MGLQAGGGGPYRGPERRRRNDGRVTSPPLSGVLALFGIVTVGAWLPALFLVPRHPSAADLGAYAAIAAGLAYAVAGGCRLVVWKVTGRAVFGWLGPAFVVLGVMLAVCDGLSTFGLASVPAVRPVAGLLWTGLVGGLMCRGLVDREVNAGLRPFVTLVSALAAGLAAMGLLGVAQLNGLLPPWITGRPAEIGFSATSALVWLAVAALAFRASRRSPPGVAPWAAVAAGLLAASFGVRVLSSVPWAATGFSSAFLFSAAVLTLATSIHRVQQILAWEDKAQRRLQLALTASIYQTARDRRALDHWIHDLRNAVAGLQAADAVLRGGNEARSAAEHELADAITAELARLHAMVDPARQLDITEVDLAATLGPVVAAERARGAPVALRLLAQTVMADAPSLSRVVQNLLANARLYAPGSAVTVTAVPRDRAVEISVQDGGPGIAIAERSAVFEPGERGIASAGTDGNGLGLYVARTLVTAMGGSIVVGSGENPGCRMVITLPAPAPAAGTARTVASPPRPVPARIVTSA